MKYKIEVNRSYMDEVLNPLTGLADSDEDTDDYSYLDSNNEQQVKLVITKVMKPHFDGCPIKYKEAIKLVLKYYLTTSKIDFGGLFYSNLLPFAPPKNPKDFFIWVWEVFFCNESYIIDNIDDYVEVNRIREPREHFLIR